MPAVRGRITTGAVLASKKNSSEELEQDILTAEPPARHQMIEEAPESIKTALVESLAARARNASVVSPAESMRIAEIVEEVSEALDTPRAQAFALWARGAALRSHAQYEEALEAFLLGASRAQQSGDAALAARIPLGATDTLAQLGRYDEALLLSSSLEFRLNALGLEEDAAKVVANAGNVHFQREAYAEALDCWERALTYFESRGDQVRAARLQMNVANVLVCLHRLPESMQMYEAASKILEEARMDFLVAGLNGDLGYLRFMAGQHNEALQAYSRARSRFESLDLPKDVAQCDRETADVYLDLNLIPEAKETYERVVPLFQERHMTAEAARSDFGLARALFQQGHFVEAHAALGRAEAAFHQEGNSSGVARAWLCRATFLHRQQSLPGAENPQNDTQARSQAMVALRLFQEQGMALETVEAQLLLSEIRVSQGHSPVRTLQQLAKTAEAGAFRSLQWRIETALARASRNAGKEKAALEHYRLAVQSVEKSRLIIQGDEFRIAFLRDKLRLYEELLGLLLDQDTPDSLEEAFEVMEQAKSRTLLESMVSKQGQDQTEDHERQELLRHLEDLRAQLNWQYLRSEQPSGGADRIPAAGRVTPEDLRAIEKEYLQTHRQLAIMSTDTTENSYLGVTRITDIQALLHEDEQVVAYATVYDEILAYVISKEEFQVLRGLASRKEVEQQVERLRFQWHKVERHPRGRALDPRLQETTEEILRELYDSLIDPVRDLLLGELLTIVPHGVLHNVPFHALYDGEEYLTDRWEIAYAPSCAVWRVGRQQAEPQGEKSLVYGIPDEGIAHTREEIANLRQVLPKATIFEEQEATLAAVPKEGVFQYIHFATHAVFRKDNPMFSALHLSDGWLFAHDLYRRRLECSLAVLSACHTGTGGIAPGDEVLGLVRGFLHAGARAVLVSMWAADDVATTALMKECYAGMSIRMGRAMALRMAQHVIRARLPHPYYWASFALIGVR